MMLGRRKRTVTPASANRARAVVCISARRLRRTRRCDIGPILRNKRAHNQGSD